MSKDVANDLDQSNLRRSKLTIYSPIMNNVIMSLYDIRLEELGFQRGWIVRKYAFAALAGLARSQLPPSITQILPASQADFENYD